MYLKDRKKHYEPGDEIIRLELREERQSRIPLRFVAILNVAGKEVEAELPRNVNHHGINGVPITSRFEWFLWENSLAEPVKPRWRQVGAKKHQVSYVRQGSEPTRPIPSSAPPGELSFREYYVRYGRFPGMEP